jgi:DNA-binding Lrp family transcriptional regulator
LKPEIKDILKFLRILQIDLPLTPRPFAAIAKKAGLSTSAVLEQIRSLKRTGAIRRFGAVIHHRNAGYSCNAMVAVDATPVVLRKLVSRILKTPGVTHCYERAAFPDWPYTLYFMLHAKTGSESKAALSKLFDGMPLQRKKVLYSAREFKKVSFRL